MDDTPGDGIVLLTSKRRLVDNAAHEDALFAWWVGVGVLRVQSSYRRRRAGRQVVALRAAPGPWRRSVFSTHMLRKEGWEWRVWAATEIQTLARCAAARARVVERRRHVAAALQIQCAVRCGASRTRLAALKRMRAMLFIQLCARRYVRRFRERKRIRLALRIQCCYRQRLARHRVRRYRWRRDDRCALRIQVGYRDWLAWRVLRRLAQQKVAQTRFRIMARHLWTASSMRYVVRRWWSPRRPSLLPRRLGLKMVRTVSLAAAAAARQKATAESTELEEMAARATMRAQSRRGSSRGATPVMQLPIEYSVPLVRRTKKKTAPVATNEPPSVLPGLVPSYDYVVTAIMDGKSV